MLVLFETVAGYAIFKLLDDKKLAQSDNLYLDFKTPEAAREILSLKYFHKFADVTEALAATKETADGKLTKSLKKTLRECGDIQEQLAVADAKLGIAIKEKFGLSCVNNTAVQELMRCIRSQADSLITIPQKEITAIRLGLAHSLSRYRLKFTPDKVDTMVIQAVSLLDELDKELNNYIMRCREWYGWHFPELSRMIPDNMAYIKTVRIIGRRDEAVHCDLSDILLNEIEEQVKEAAETSMGTEISEEDASFTQSLCTEIIELSEYRIQLYDYVKNRMMMLAPNLSILVGELVGARLLSHAGSLINLAKHPASTVQILGAEKALFRALKTKKDTPKYGLIYHSQLVGQSSRKNKGKMSRMLAAKASLATRVDALAETTNFDLGTEHRAKLEARLRFLEEGNIRKISGTTKAKAKFEKYHSKNEYAQYSISADSTLSSKKRPLIEEINLKQENEEPKKKKKKHNDSIKESAEGISFQQEEVQEKEEPTISKKKKKRNKGDKNKEEEEISTSNQQQEMQMNVESDVVPKKKKKLSMKTENTGGSCDVQEVERKVESDTISKKKKKHSIKTEDTRESLGAQEKVQEVEVELDVSKKKKKKRSLEIKTEDIEEVITQVEPQAETDPDIIPKKKKKKKSKEKSIEMEENTLVKTEEMERQMDVSVKSETSETSEGQKKKKKKKKEKE